jgi:hypothetical protein
VLVGPRVCVDGLRNQPDTWRSDRHPPATSFTWAVEWFSGAGLSFWRPLGQRNLQPVGGLDVCGAPRMRDTRRFVAFRSRARCPTPTLSRGRPALPAYRYPPTFGGYAVLPVDNSVGCGQPARDQPKLSVLCRRLDFGGRRPTLCPVGRVVSCRTGLLAGGAGLWDGGGFEVWLRVCGSACHPVDLPGAITVRRGSPGFCCLPWFGLFGAPSPHCDRASPGRRDGREPLVVGIRRLMVLARLPL